MARAPQGAPRQQFDGDPRDNVIEGQLVQTSEKALLKASDFVDIDASVITALAEAQIDKHMEYAHRRPRQKQQAVNDIIELVTWDTRTAQACMYALPRGRDPETGKPKAITGESIRFFEIVAQCWGNCHADAHPTSINRRDKYIEAEGIYFDFQTNFRNTTTVRRRISGKSGAIFNDDMINVTAQAAVSIAKRNAIKGGIPSPAWKGAYDRVEAVIRGELKTLGARRVELLTRFRDELKVGHRELFAILGVVGEADIGLDELVVASGFFTALRNNEVTMEDLMAEAAGPRSVEHRTLGNAYAGASGPAVGSGAASEPAPAVSPPPPPPPPPAAHDDDGVVIEDEGENVIAGPAPAGARYGWAEDDEEDGAYPVYVDGVSIGKLETEQWPAQGLSVYEQHAPLAKPPEDPKPAPPAGRGRGSPASAKPAPEASQAPKDSGQPQQDAPSSAGDPSTEEEIQDGVAGPDEVYLIAGEPWIKTTDGKERRISYKNGQSFSSAGRKPYEAGEILVYGAHPVAADVFPGDRQLAGESKSPPTSDASQAPEAAAENRGLAVALDAYREKVRSTESWLTIKAALGALRKIGAFAELPAELQAPELIFAYTAGKALADAGKDPVKISDDPSFYALWLETEPSHAEIDDAWARLTRSPAYKALKEPHKDALAAATLKAKGEDV